MEVLGIDIGVTGIKGAIVDTEVGDLCSKVKTIDPVKTMEPHKLVSKVHKLVKKFSWKGPIGCAFPAPIGNGMVLSTHRIHDSWLDVDVEHLFSEITDHAVSVLNDSDAAGMAEMKFGVGKDKSGTVIVLTVGDGVGSSVFNNGKLIPNVELGFVEQRGITVEERISNRVRKEEGITHKTWGTRLQYILENYERMFHPSLFILGGQLSKKADKTFPFIKLGTKFKPASFTKEASIVGAAMYAYQKQSQKKEFFM